MVSRGGKGAVVVCREQALEGIVNSDIPAVNTVGCGDYLLAGFLDGLALNDGIDSALERGLKTAAARAFGWTEQIEWARAEGRLNAVVSKVTM